MTMGEKTYYDIQETGKKNIEYKASCVLRDLEPILGKFNFPIQYDSINKIYSLIGAGCYPWMEEILLRYGYDYRAELQYLLANITYGERKMGYETIKSFVTKFPSVKSMYRGSNEYQLDTKFGTLTLTPLTRYEKDYKVKNFALQKETLHACHMATQEFIRVYPEYRAITSLVPNQFGEQHYHSYIKTSDGYIDFANNVHLPTTDFENIMQPDVLNSTCGYELTNLESELTTNDLPSNKSLLLRLAVHNQTKKYD